MKVLHEATAACLIEQVPEILRRWEARVRREVPAAKELEGSTLYNNLRPFLGEVASTLAPAAQLETPAESNSAREHGSLRALLPAYSVGDVFREYRLLRQTILEVLDERHCAAPDERDQIADALDLAMEEAAGQYALVHDQAERRRGDEACSMVAHLVEVDRDKVETTSLIVHDLRTPLTCFLVSLQTLQMSGRLGQGDDELVSIAVQGGQKLLRMINDVLDISRSEAGKLTLEFQMLEPAALVERALREIEPLAREKGLSLVDDVAPGLAPFRGDGEKLGRVLTNLLGNAVQFTPNGGTIHVTAATDTSGDVEFSVRDTGEGIPGEAFDDIFEMFGQGRRRTPGQTRSSGLGLRFCKIVVEAHRGRIHVESEPGQGSRFAFNVPALRSGMPPDSR
jgi:signal transduction histidine kinase